LQRELLTGSHGPSHAAAIRRNSPSTDNRIAAQAIGNGFPDASERQNHSLAGENPSARCHGRIAFASAPICKSSQLGGSNLGHTTG
jgi:hypothetical protein